MLFTRLLHFFWGYDIIRFEENPELAMEILGKQRIIYKTVKPDQSGRKGIETEHRHKSEVISLLDKNGIRVYSIKVCGFPALLERYRSRPGIPAGIIVFIMTLMLSTQFIWNVRVYGDGSIPEDEIIAGVSELGCGVGSFIPGIDFYHLCTKYLADSESIAWMSVNILGTTAEIRYLPRSLPEGRLDESRPANVISAADGTVEYVNTFAGAPVVSDGVSVVKGQLLISGVIEDKNDGSCRYVRADGAVMARTYHELVADIPLVYEERVYSGELLEKKEYEIFAFRVALPSKEPPSGQFETESGKSRVTLPGNIILPITEYVTSYYPYSVRTTERTEESAAALADAEMADRIRDELRGAEILSRETETEIIRDENGNPVFRLRCRIRCIENISVVVPITVTG